MRLHEISQNYAKLKINGDFCGLLICNNRKRKKRPLNEVASSHIARRCFVGNLYKQVKDPNLVGKLSGHKEGSKAFARH